MRSVSANAVQFDRVVARELVEARVEVHDWAEDLLADQRKTWLERRRKRLANKPYPATRQDCIEKSREIRIKRERNATYWNDTTNPNAQY